MTIWMKVTQDKYELPLMVADTSIELAKMDGVTPSTIYSRMSHFNKGEFKTRKYIKVVCDD